MQRTIRMLVGQGTPDYFPKSLMRIKYEYLEKLMKYIEETI
jgi:hypothetical protein